ncbi:acyl-coenzyme A thioesterase 9, mitochondrial-like [Contarinia nasturtii]|uniref:acyl-coenzyme A thioesterase 9, mitochondrial-like n=1 Tax=Contarinia nasturtii TaxID=265458 RepID=UPI0012D46E1D|nr:acyl-coenzyme A thioesterase 9, mitochondrial-like [Contarinia nasturtii]
MLQLFKRPFVLTNVLRSSGVWSQNRYCTNNVNKENVAGTMSDVKAEIAKKLGIQEYWSVLPKNREHLIQYEPKSIDELPPRSMQDSFTSAIIPLSSDLTIRDKYVTFLGSVRLGRLMEDMDAFAVWILHKHVLLPNLDPSTPLPYTFVTLLVDQISFTEIIPKNDSDIRLSGHASWVGRSSVEVVVWLEQKIQGKWRKLTRATFLMACRNATNTAAAIVNPLKPANDEEKRIFTGGENRKRRRIQSQKESIFNQEPNAFEQKHIHNIFMKTMDLNNKSFNVRKIPPGAMWMEDAQLSNVIYSHPEDRNAHNSVFGGYLMRQALELSWALVYTLNRGRCRLRCINDITFTRPVPVSSLLKMHAHVVYTDMNYIEIVVVNETYDAISAEHTTSNVFYYTYVSDTPVPQVIPRSYNEAMWYLDGRRKFNAAMNLDGGNDVKIEGLTFPQ